MVMQRLAKPSTPVRFWPPPPIFTSAARVVKSVDTADLKSAAYLNKGRAGSIPAPGTMITQTDTQQHLINPVQTQCLRGFFCYLWATCGAD